MLKRLINRPLLATVIILAGLIVTAPMNAEDSARSFRKQNGLQPYAPPTWFLEGYFIARERNPGYVFGPVQDFVRALGGKTTWLIEDLELERLAQASPGGTPPEYSLFLEAVSDGHPKYWVFVILPHESAGEWFAARRAYHGRKAESYYGNTQSMLERALNQGLKIKAEMRYFLEKGNISLKAPEEIIMNKYQFKPVYDLGKGRWLGSAAKTN